MSMIAYTTILILTIGNESLRKRKGGNDLDRLCIALYDALGEWLVWECRNVEELQFVIRPWCHGAFAALSLETGWQSVLTAIRCARSWGNSSRRCFRRRRPHPNSLLRRMSKVLSLLVPGSTHSREASHAASASFKRPADVSIWALSLRRHHFASRLPVASEMRRSWTATASSMRPSFPRLNGSSSQSLLSGSLEPSELKGL